MSDANDDLLKGISAVLAGAGGKDAEPAADEQPDDQADANDFAQRLAAAERAANAMQ